jgi:hypothetical protein
MTQCAALVYDLEKTENGTLVPKRCTKNIHDNTSFCILHKKEISKYCTACSKNSGNSVTHTHQWQHLGTYIKPSFVFDQYRADLLKKYEKKHDSKSKSSDTSIEQTDLEYDTELDLWVDMDNGLCFKTNDPDEETIGYIDKNGNYKQFPIIAD